MTSTHKQQTKALKAQDPIQARLTLLLDWMLKNANVFFGAFAVLVLGAGAYYGWTVYRESGRSERVEALGQVYVVFDSEQRQAAEARDLLVKKIEAIDAKAVAPAAKPGEPSQPAAALDAASLAEKASLQAQADAIKPDHQGSRAQFEAFAKDQKYADTPEGWHAGMTAAKLYMDDEKFAEARPLLESVLARSKDSPFYQVQARLAFVGLLEETGDFDKALEETGTLEKIVDKELLPRVLLTRGRLQMLKNAKEDAKTTFAHLIETHGTTPEAQKARSIQGLLN